MLREHETIAVRVKRPLMYLGKRCEAEAVLQVPPLDAWQLCSGGRAELADAARDGAAVVAAVHAHAEAVSKLQRRETPLPHRADPRWQPR